LVEGVSAGSIRKVSALSDLSTGRYWIEDRVISGCSGRNKARRTGYCGYAGRMRLGDCCCRGRVEWNNSACGQNKNACGQERLAQFAVSWDFAREV